MCYWWKNKFVANNYCLLQRWKLGDAKRSFIERAGISTYHPKCRWTFAESRSAKYAVQFINFFSFRHTAKTRRSPTKRKRLDSFVFLRFIMPTNAGPSPAGGQWRPAPPFEIGAPPFHVWLPGCCIHPILYFKIVAPLLVFGPSFWFLPPLLLHPGDGPAQMLTT